MKILNVLYQSDDNYAVVTGVSMVSLMENNKDIDEINFYVLNDNIADQNISKLKQAAEQYGRTLTIIETDAMLRKLRDEFEVSPHKGTYTTYFKLLAIKTIQIPTDRILLLDGDTVITGSLAPLLDLVFENNIMAATYDCIANGYKELIGIPLTDKYYNCGVTLYNQPLWISEKCEEKIIEHMQTVRNRYYIVDQDIQNLLFRHRVKYLDITYNFNSGFYIYGIKNSFYIYDLPPEYYDSYEKVKSVSKSPIIYHCMGAQTGRPWELGNNHPQNELFDQYLRASPWHDYNKKKVKRSLIFKVQRALYVILSLSLYAKIHRKGVLRYLRKMNKTVQKHNDEVGMS